MYSKTENQKRGFNFGVDNLHAGSIKLCKSDFPEIREVYR